MNEIVETIRELIKEEELAKENEIKLHKKWTCFYDDEKPDLESTIKNLTLSLELSEQEKAKKEATAVQLGFDLENYGKAHTDTLGELNMLQRACENRTGELNQEQLDLQDAVEKLDNAINALQNIQGAGDDGNPSVSERIGALNNAVSADTASTARLLRSNRALFLSQLNLPSSLKKTVLSLLPTSKFEPQSAEVLGILKSMRDTMTSDLKSSDELEGKHHQGCQKQEGLLNNQLSLLNDSLARSGSAKGATEDRIDALETLIATSNTSLHANLQALASLQENNKENEYKFRMRRDMHVKQISALKTALTILDSDAGFNLFNKYQNLSSAALLLSQQLLQMKNQYSGLKTGPSSLLEIRRSARGKVALPPAIKLICGVEKAKVDVERQETADAAWKTTCDTLRREKNEEIETHGTNLQANSDERQQLVDFIQSTAAKLNESTLDHHNFQAVIKSLQETRDAEHTQFMEETGDYRSAISMLAKAIEILREAGAYLSKRNQKHTYRKMENSDFRGETLENHPGKTLEELEAVCTEIGPVCGGFTKSGSLKTAEAVQGTPIAVEGQDVYVKSYVEGESNAKITTGGTTYNEEAPNTTLEEVDVSSTQDVVAVLATISNNFKKELNITESDESAAVDRFNAEIRTTSDSLKAAERAITEANMELAALDEKVAINSEEEGNLRELKLAALQFLASKNESCNFIDANLENRANRLLQDREAYNQAITVVETTPVFLDLPLAEFPNCNGKGTPCTQADLFEIEKAFACEQSCQASRCEASCQQCVWNQAGNGGGANVGIVAYCQQNPNLFGCQEVLAQRGAKSSESNW